MSAKLLHSSFKQIVEFSTHTHTHTLRKKDLYMKKFENPRYAPDAKLICSFRRDWPGDTEKASQVVHQAVLSGTSQP